MGTAFGELGITLGCAHEFRRRGERQGEDRVEGLNHSNDLSGGMISRPWKNLATTERRHFLPSPEKPDIVFSGSML